jgi:hypothetical protein
VREYVTDRDQSPFNGILVELDATHLSVYTYKGGKNNLVQHTSRTDNLGDDIVDILKQVEGHSHFPSKMILYGTHDLGSEAETLKSYQWDQKMFIQPPRVEVLTDIQLFETLRSVFSGQIYSEPMVDVVRSDSVKPKAAFEAEQTEVMGFVIGEDINEHPAISQAATEETLPEEETVAPVSKSKHQGLPVFTMPTLPTSLPKNMNAITHNFKMPKLPAKGFVWLIPIAILIGLFFAFEFFIHKATVTIYVPSQTITKTVDLNVPISTSTGQEVTLVSHTITSEFSNTKDTTGERDIGEKAKGEVTIHNFDNVEKTFAKGTKLTSGNLVFTLDQDVKVASASGLSSSGSKQSGKAKGSVTASAIGPESNIEKGKQLKIAELSDALYVGIAESTFSGGSKKKVHTVAKKDLDDLKKTLAAKATEQSDEKIKSEIKPEEEIIESLTEVNSKDIEFSKEVGEEADEITLKATTEIIFYTYNEVDMKQTLSTALQSDLPSGYKPLVHELVYEIKETEKDDESTASLTVDVTEKVAKELQKEKVVSQLSGKSTSQLVTIARNQLEAEDAAVNNVFPALPIIKDRLPFFSKNITVTISAK